MPQITINQIYNAITADPEKYQFLIDQATAGDGSKEDVINGISYYWLEHADTDPYLKWAASFWICYNEDDPGASVIHFDPTKFSIVQSISALISNELDCLDNEPKFSLGNHFGLGGDDSYDYNSGYLEIRIDYINAGMGWEIEL